MTSNQMSEIALAISALSLLVSILTGAWTVYSNVSASKETLSIRHGDASAIINFVERLNEYVTAFCLNLVITNISPDRTITIAEYRLEIPWRDGDLRTL